MFYKNPSFICMSVFGVRLVALGATIGDSIAMCALCALYGYTQYLEHKQIKPINESVLQELAHVRDTVNALKVAKSFGR